MSASTPTRIETALLACSPLDGRYYRATAAVGRLMGEFGLHRARLSVEVEWLIALARTEGFDALAAPDAADVEALRAIAAGFEPTDAVRVREFEATTNHDVKAIEYFLREQIDADTKLARFRPFVHFACTSEDINNLAYALMLDATRRQVLLPRMDAIVAALNELARIHAHTPMLSRTHGQPASPTTLGKEIRVFAARLERQRNALASVLVLGKINGAVGNYNAHVVAAPEVDWPALGREVVAALGLTFNPLTTQIEPHDYIAEYAHALMRFNQICLDFCRDVWSYISIGYFRQRLVEGETGSSTMPHKVNPIDFENAEGNLGIANAMLDHLAQKLTVSRWQRDLSDSTALRNLGTGLGQSDLAWQSLTRGLGKLEVDAAALLADLDDSWEVLGEAVQTLMRAEGIDDAYEQVKAATRGRKLDAAGYVELLDALPISPTGRARLAALTPATYVGLAAKLALGADTAA